MKIQLPEKVNRIITTLQKHGFESYAVGGCVRDSFLGRVPGDWDITTSAAPEETKSLFARTFDTGIEHGTITVLLNGEGFEVTTYRIAGNTKTTGIRVKCSLPEVCQRICCAGILRSMRWRTMNRTDW